MKSTPVVKYSDILSYDSDKHTFKLSDRALDAIKSIEHSVFGVAFAVTANGRVVYTGYFWPMFSSASCNWATIEPFMAEFTKELKVTLGYPGDWRVYRTEGMMRGYFQFSGGTRSLNEFLHNPCQGLHYNSLLGILT